MKLVKPPNIIDLKKDLAFKLYFKEDTGVLISLLEHFLPLPPGSRIVEVDVIDGESVPTDMVPPGKTFVLDLRAKIRRKVDGRLLDAETVNVEIQSSFEEYFTDRLLAYASRIYTAQIERGDDYDKLFPVYSLAFCAANVKEFNSLPGEYYHLCSIRREDTAPARQPIFSRGIRFVVVELAKFAKQTGELVDLRDAWCYLLKEAPHMSGTEFEAIGEKGEEMGNAVKRLWNLSEEDHVRIQIEAREKQLKDQRSREKYQRKQGLAEGEKKGREEGEKKGREEGEKKGKREVALQMLGKGLDIATICECTGLTEKEVEALKPRKK